MIRLRTLSRAIAITLLLANPVAAGELRGYAKVVDGDGVVVDGERIRLLAIDAPEKNEPLGKRATAELAQIIGRQALRCETVERDRYGRWVGICRRGSTDIGRAMVRNGWARAWPRYGMDYVADEAAARSARLGMWAAGMERARASRRHPD